MCPLVATEVGRVIRTRKWASDEFDETLFGAAADAAEEAGDPDLAAGLRSGRCPLYVKGYTAGEYGWADGWVWRNVPDHRDNLPQEVFAALTGVTETAGCGSQRTYRTWQEAFRDLGRVLRAEGGDRCVHFWRPPSGESWPVASLGSPSSTAF